VVGALSALFLLLLQATREVAAAEKAEAAARAENMHDAKAREVQMQHSMSPATGTGGVTGVTQVTPLGPTGPLGGRASESGAEGFTSGVTPGYTGEKLVTPGAVAAAPGGPEIESSGLGEEATGPLAPREEGKRGGSLHPNLGKFSFSYHHRRWF
jgi:hypothetical protein